MMYIGGVKVEKLIRKNFNMSRDMANWLEAKSAELGISQSSLIVMAIDDWRRSREIISNIDKMSDLVDKVQKANKEMMKK